MDYDNREEIHIDNIVPIILSKIIVKMLSSVQVMLIVKHNT